MTVDIKKLKAAALAATQGEWRSSPGNDDGDYPIVFVDLPAGGPRAISTLFEADWATDEDAEFVGLANPAAVLDLIAKNEKLVAQLCVCPSCHGEGETYTGRTTWEGHFQPPEPIMEKCGECDGDGVIGDASDLANLLSENAKLKAENERLKAEIELLRKAVGR